MSLIPPAREADGAAAAVGLAAPAGGPRRRGAGSLRVDSPRWIPVAAAVGMALVVLPVVAMAGRVDWPRFWPLVTSPSSLAALELSLRTALTSALLCVLLGVPMALWFARSRSRVVGALRAAVLLPLVLPPVVGGIALISLFGRRGLLGPVLESAGITVAFTTTAVVLAQTFVALPFLVVSVEGALRTSGTRPAAVAATLGARPGRVLTRVTLPALGPALAAGAVLSFARALGEFGATLTFAGSLEGVTRTLPLQIYLQRETDPDAAVALALVLVVVAVGVMAATGLVAPVGRPRRRRRPAPPSAELPRMAATTRSWRPSEAARPAERAGRDAGGAAVALAARVRVPERGVDAEIAVGAGEVLALVGSNGAGKSTVVEAIAGLVPSERAADGAAADGGGPGAAPGGSAPRSPAADVTLGGRALDGLPPWARRVALVDQRPVILTRGRLIDEVAFAAGARSGTREQAREAASRALESVGLADLAQRRTSQLSGGQVQRLAIARALAADPELLVLDEPFASLDSASVASVRALLAAEHGRRTIILVTHDPVDAVRIADRVAVLDRGRVVESGPLAAVLARPDAAATRAFAAGSVIPGTVRADRLEASAGPLAGASIPLPAGHGIEDGAPAVAAIASDEVVVRAG